MTPPVLSNAAAKASAKRWAKANGYHGAQGGWIYTTDHRPVVQGWAAFFDKFRARILAEVEAGTFELFSQPKGR